ncbi:uncharacterized protein NPIL_378881 [Nephila pilipes]|uniref:Uncharacterized protein n=1 Tax=Nephila pilipes TaxID=299642 RepID=A0A8X6UDP4_NEPPI|nr:uncharacterized protein NPIL_378881 [Nephila pilipes]
MDYFPQNTQASFRTKLSRPIILTGEWEAGLSEIFVPRTWFNIGNHNNKYSITYEETKIVEKDVVGHEIRVKIDPGMADEDMDRPPLNEFFRASITDKPTIPEMKLEKNGAFGAEAPLLQCSSSTSDIPQCTSTSNIFPEASRSEVRPFIPTDSEQNKGDDSEKGDNEEVQSNNESNRDRESEEDKERPERFTDLDVEMLNDIALWPTTLTDLMIDYIIRKKPNNIGNIETLKSVYKDRDQVYYWGLSYDHFYRKKTNGVKEERNWLVFSETSKAVYC